MKHLLLNIILLLYLSNCSFKAKKINTIREAENITDTIYKIDGSMLTVIIKKDSLTLGKYKYLLDNESVLDTVNNTTIKYQYESPGALGGKWTEYYPNGKLKAKGQVANQFGCWMNAGTFAYYGIDGVLSKQLIYTNWLAHQGDGWRP